MSGRCKMFPARVHAPSGAADPVVGILWTPDRAEWCGEGKQVAVVALADFDTMTAWAREAKRLLDFVADDLRDIAERAGSTPLDVEFFAKRCLSRLDAFSNAPGAPKENSNEG